MRVEDLDMQRFAFSLYALTIAGIGIGFAGCGGTPAATPSNALLPAPPAGTGLQMTMEMDAPASAETWKCLVTNMPNEDLANINRVEHSQTPGLHHMDLTALLSVNLEPGTYDCGPLYAAHPELMEQTTLYGSQTATAQLDLGPGVVAKVPSGLPVLFELHYLNATKQPVHVVSTLNAYTIDAHAVTASISGAAIRDRHMLIPPAVDHTEWTRCVMDHDVDLLVVSSHTHALAREFEILDFDGTTTGARVYVNDEWATPKLQQFQPARRIPAGSGFEFRCHYFNDGDHPVEWGFKATDEMCNMVLVWTPAEAGAACKVVATSDNILDP
jgi:hypothetical protein